MTSSWHGAILHFPEKCCIKRWQVVIDENNWQSSFTNPMRLLLLFSRSFEVFHMLLILTHWGRVTHICVTYLTIIASDNGLSPSRRQAIIWTNAGILLIRSLGTNFSEILIEIHIFSFKKMHLKMWSGKWRPFCLGLNVLNISWYELSLHWFTAFIYIDQGQIYAHRRRYGDNIILIGRPLICRTHRVRHRLKFHVMNSGGAS